MLLLRFRTWCVVLLLYGACISAQDVGTLASTDAPVAFDASATTAFATPANNAASVLTLSPLNELHLYVGGTSGGLAWFSRANATSNFALENAWDRLGFEDAILSVSHLSISSDGAFLAASGDKVTPFGSLGIFRLAADGTPSLLLDQQISDIKGALFAPDSSSDLYTIDQTTNELQHWRYSAGTAAFAVEQRVLIEGSSSVSGLFISPDGASVYVHDSAAAKSHNFARGAATGELSAAPVSTLEGNPSLNGADGIGHWADVAFSSDGQYAFALETLSGLITTLARNTNSGALAVLHKVSPSYADGTAVTLSFDTTLTLAPDGSGDLYILGAANDQIGWYRFNKSSEQVGLIDWIDVGNRPRSLLLDSSSSSSLLVGYSAASTDYKWKGQLLIRTAADTTTVRFSTVLVGESADSFTSAEQTAFRAAVAQSAGIAPAARILITALADAGAGLKVTYSIAGFGSAAESDAAAAALISATTAGTLLQKFTVAAAAAGTPASSAIAMQSTTVLSDTAATEPPMVPVLRASDKPDAAVIAPSTVGALLGVLGIAAALLCLRKKRARKRELELEESKYVLALQVSPKDAFMHNEYGHFLQQKRADTAGAERHFRQAIQFDTTAAYAHNSLGHLLQHARKDIDGAENSYREAIRLQPTNSDAFCNLGHLLQYERDDLSGAEQCFRSAVHFDPSDQDAQDRLDKVVAVRAAALRSGANQL